MSDLKTKSDSEAARLGRYANSSKKNIKKLLSTKTEVKEFASLKNLSLLPKCHKTIHPNVKNKRATNTSVPEVTGVSEPKANTFGRTSLSNQCSLIAGLVSTPPLFDPKLKNQVR